MPWKNIFQNTRNSNLKTFWNINTKQQLTSIQRTFSYSLWMCKILTVLSECSERAEAECPLIEGNKNCFGCIRQSKKSIITKALEQDPKADPPAKNDLSTQTCQLCPYSSNFSKPAKILIANPNYKPVHSETDIRKPGKYCWSNIEIYGKPAVTGGTKTRSRIYLSKCIVTFIC